jgi:hypothetical protein
MKESRALISDQRHRFLRRTLQQWSRVISGGKPGQNQITCSRPLHAESCRRLPGILPNHAGPWLASFCLSLFLSVQRRIEKNEAGKTAVKCLCLAGCHVGFGSRRTETWTHRKRKCSAFLGTLRLSSHCACATHCSLLPTRVGPTHKDSFSCKRKTDLEPEFQRHTHPKCGSGRYQQLSSNHRLAFIVPYVAFHVGRRTN